MQIEKLTSSTYSVYTVCDNRGDSQVLDFLTSLDGSLSNDVSRMLELLESCANQGLPRNAKICHIIDRANKIWQLRQGDLRVLFFTDKGKMILCTHGFIKKQNKTPEKDIKRANSAKKVYVQAKMNNTLEIVQATGEQDHE